MFGSTKVQNALKALVNPFREMFEQLNLKALELGDSDGTEHAGLVKLAFVYYQILGLSSQLVHKMALLICVLM